jgi:hypothetical protein
MLSSAGTLGHSKQRADVICPATRARRFLWQEKLACVVALAGSSKEHSFLLRTHKPTPRSVRFQTHDEKAYSIICGLDETKWPVGGATGHMRTPRLREGFGEASAPCSGSDERSRNTLPGGASGHIATRGPEQHLPENPVQPEMNFGACKDRSPAFGGALSVYQIPASMPRIAIYSFVWTKGLPATITVALTTSENRAKQCAL